MSLRILPETLEEITISRERANYVHKLFAILEDSKSPDRNDFILLFNFYKIQESFTPESLHTLLIDQLIFNKLVPLLITSTSVSLFSTLFKSNTPLSLDTFLTLSESIDFLELQKITSSSDENNIDLHQRNLLCQIPIPSSHLEALDEKTYQDELLSEFETIGLNPKSMAVVKNFNLSILEFIVTFDKDIGVLTFPPRFVLANEKLEGTLNCRIYKGEILPSENLIFSQGDMLKDAGDYLSSTAIEIGDKLKIKEGFDYGKQAISGGYERVKESVLVQNAGETIGNFFSSIKESITGDKKE